MDSSSIPIDLPTVGVAALAATNPVGNFVGNPVAMGITGAGAFIMGRVREQVEQLEDATAHAISAAVSGDAEAQQLAEEQLTTALAGMSPFPAAPLGAAPPCTLTGCCCMQRCHALQETCWTE